MIWLVIESVGVVGCFSFDMHKLGTFYYSPSWVTLVVCVVDDGVDLQPPNKLVQSKILWAENYQLIIHFFCKCPRSHWTVLLVMGISDL